MSFTDLKLFALSSNQKLAEKVSHIIRDPFSGKSSVRQFSDGEIQVNIEEVYPWYACVHSSIN